MPHAAVSSAVFVAVLAAGSCCRAEPVVVRFENGVKAAELGALHPDLPPVTLGEWTTIGGGQITVYPRLYPTDYLIDFCFPPPFAVEQATDAGPGAARYDTSPLGAEVGPAIAGWDNAFNCFDFDITWPSILSGSTDFSCSLPGCPTDIALGFAATPGVNAVPIRLSSGDGGWNYAWIAFRFEEIVTPDCSFCGANPPVDLITGDWAVVGFGYETDPDTPISNGGGLCPADLNLDARLDNADLTAFVQAFLAGDASADFNPDGIYDLADVVGFVRGFNAGCGL